MCGLPLESRVHGGDQMPQGRQLEPNMAGPGPAVPGTGAPGVSVPALGQGPCTLLPPRWERCLSPELRRLPSNGWGRAGAAAAGERPGCGQGSLGRAGGGQCASDGGLGTSPVGLHQGRRGRVSVLCMGSPSSVAVCASVPQVRASETCARFGSANRTAVATSLSSIAP